jgi:hypothetical protein
MPQEFADRQGYALNPSTLRVEGSARSAGGEANKHQWQQIMKDFLWFPQISQICADWIPVFVFYSVFKHPTI